MAHVAKAKQEIMFYDYVDEDLTLWQAFFLILWSYCVYVCKVFEIFQTLNGEWLGQALKQSKLQPPKAYFFLVH
jgi:hypothetical protein